MKWLETKCIAAGLGSNIPAHANLSGNAKMIEELSKKHDDHVERNWHGESMKNWRAWGSWFSWGSPIGLTLGYAITLVSTGIFIYLLALARHVK
jgi:hypothetical protein